jgi:hypothetical protein
MYREPATRFHAAGSAFSHSGRSDSEALNIGVPLSSILVTMNSR